MRCSLSVCVIWCLLPSPFFPLIYPGVIMKWLSHSKDLSFFSLFSSVAFYYRCLLWIRSGSVSKSWQAFSCSYVTLGRQLSAVQNVFLSIICTLKSLADTLTYPQWPSKSIAHLSDILFWINTVGQCEVLKEWKKKCWKYTFLLTSLNLWGVVYSLRGLRPKPDHKWKLWFITWPNKKPSIHSKCFQWIIIERRH